MLGRGGLYDRRGRAGGAVFWGGAVCGGRGSQAVAAAGSRARPLPAVSACAAPGRRASTRPQPLHSAAMAPRVAAR